MKEFSFSQKLKEMKESKRRDIQIIALYWKWKHWFFDNKLQYQAALRRELRPAKNLIGYSDEDIKDTFKYLDEVMKPKKIKWTLETTWKFIDDIRAGRRVKLSDDELIKLEYGTTEEKKSIYEKIKKAKNLKI